LKPPRINTTKTWNRLTVAESLVCNVSLPVSTNIVGVDSVEQLDQHLKGAANFVTLSEAQMRVLEQRTLPIVRQVLYFLRWDLAGARLFPPANAISLP
jgi:hypothetical protein